MRELTAVPTSAKILAPHKVLGEGVKNSKKVQKETNQLDHRFKGVSFFCSTDFSLYNKQLKFPSSQNRLPPFEPLRLF